MSDDQDVQTQDPAAENLEAQASADNASSEDEGDIDLDSIADIPVELTAVLGGTVMPVSQLLKLGRGAVLKLDRKVGEPIDVFVNNRLIARGEVVIVENRIGVTMTEIIKSETEV